MKNVLKGLSQSRRQEIADVFNDAVSKIYQIGYEDGQASTVEDAVVDTIEHEGMYLQMVDREYKDGDYVRVQHKDGYCFKPNKIYGPVKGGEVKADSSTGKEDFETARVYNSSYGRDASTVEVFEVVDFIDEMPLQDIPVIPTANQQRAELIQRARDFVEDMKTSYKGKVANMDGTVVEANYTGIYIVPTNVRNPKHPHVKKCVCNAEFIVLPDKRKVICLMRAVESNSIHNRGIAKCMPGDVFNESIGQAIALAKALEIEIPQEFLKAVQPDEIVVGMIAGPKEEEVAYFSDSGKVPLKVTRVDDCGDVHRSNGKNSDKEDFKIIDDTNAVYPV